jgi:hypothetical protein
MFECSWAQIESSNRTCMAICETASLASVPLSSLHECQAFASRVGLLPARCASVMSARGRAVLAVAVAAVESR